MPELTRTNPPSQRYAHNGWNKIKAENFEPISQHKQHVKDLVKAIENLLPFLFRECLRSDDVRIKKSENILVAIKDSISDEMLCYEFGDEECATYVIQHEIMMTKTPLYQWVKSIKMKEEV